MTRRRMFLLAGLVVVVLVGVFAFRTTQSTVAGMAEAGLAVPTARLERGDLYLTVHMTGELRAARQQAIMAPAVGGALRILTLLETGTAAKTGEVIMSFDPADQLYALEQAESELLEAEQEIIKRQADAGAQEAQDKVALLTVDFNVRRAELDAAVDEDLIPANEYKIRQVSLQEARRTRVQTEQDVRSRATMSRAGGAVLEEKRAKAQVAADRARQAIDSLVIKAPIDGVVSVRENVDAAGGVFFSGMTLPAYRVGDTVNPGRPVIDMFDVSGMEIRAGVNEQERANIVDGQQVRVTSDVVPGVTLMAKVMAVSGLGRQVRTAGPLRVFDVTLQLERADARLRPGTSVQVIAEGKRVENVLQLPRQAVFEVEGKSVVYERGGSGFEARTVKVLHRTESRVAIEGLAEGVEIALVDPTKSASPGPSGTPAPPAAAGPAVGR